MLNIPPPEPTIDPIFQLSRDFIDLMEQDISIQEKLELLAPTRKLYLNNFFLKIGQMRESYLANLGHPNAPAVDLGSLVIDIDPQQRTSRELWDNIDGVCQRENFQSLITTQHNMTFLEYWQHLGIVDSTEIFVQQQLNNNRFDAYLRLTHLEEQAAIEKLTKILTFFKEYLQLFLILVEEFNWTVQVLGV